MKSKSRTLVALVAGIAIGVALTAGTVAVEVGATGTSTTAPAWYGCLSVSGALSKVGTTAPTCAGTKKAISWNSYPANANGTPQCTGFLHPGLDLSGCDLRSGSTFDGANLQGDDLSGANLSGIVLGANQFADFTGANLTDANLSDDALFDSIFNSANLTGANLQGAYFYDPNTPEKEALYWSGVIWSNTTCPDATNSGTGPTATCIGHGI